MSAWERAQTAAEEAELRAAIEASLLDAAPAGDVAKATAPRSPARAKVGPLIRLRCASVQEACHSSAPVKLSTWFL